MRDTSNLMSPNSLIAAVDSVANSRNKMTNPDDSLFMEKTDVAAASVDKKPVIISSGKETPKEESPEQAGTGADGSGEDCEDDDGFGELINLVSKGCSDPTATDLENEAVASKDDTSYIGLVNTSSPPASEEAVAAPTTAIDNADDTQAPSTNMHIKASNLGGSEEGADASPSPEEQAAPAVDDYDDAQTPTRNADDIAQDLAEAEGGTDMQPPQQEEAASANADGNADDILAPPSYMDNQAPSLVESDRGLAGKKNESLDRQELDVGPSQRRSSHCDRDELRGIGDSVTSVDSWGGKNGSLPPLLGVQTEPHTFSSLSLPANVVPGFENDIGNSGLENDQDGDTNPNDGSLLSPQDQIFSLPDSPNDNGQNLEDCNDDHVGYINFDKLLEPSSSEYYYSQANRKNRQIMEKVKNKKKVDKKIGNRSMSMDESQHSRISLVSERSRASSYRGPTPLRRDGSMVKGIVKNARPSGSGPCLSIDSTPSPDTIDLKMKPMKRCAFSSVDIREHERVAGDNPCVTSGVPLSIGWGYCQHPSVNLDDYEFNKGPSRDKIEMMVPATVRKQMLRDEFGVSINEMNAAMKEVNITKRQRRSSVAGEHLEGWQEVTQSAKRKFKRFLKKTSTAKEEEKLWAQAQKSAMAEVLKSNGEGSMGKSAGKINNGLRIAPEIGGAAPPIEISFQSGGGEGGAPSF
mmetsp:Transcript_53679/g.114002  ORF Transcript_53679/g.114002 Transcript_53679/m.114002 type:complete len:692 (+) Transcript_53679:256-2331(+)